MKEKTKRCGIFAALAAVLLLSAALVTSCPEALSFGGLAAPQEKAADPFVPPEGMGYIRLNFNEGSNGARTAVPGAPTYGTLASFGKVEVYISGGDGGTGYNDLNWDTTTRPPIAVNVSTTLYRVTVVGYSNPPVTTPPTDPVAIAAGSETVEVDTTAGVGVSIVMKEIVEATLTGATGFAPPNGTLTLSLTNSSGVTTADAKIINLSTGATADYATTATNVLVPANTTFSLKPGYYRLELSLAKDDHASNVIREIIIIGSSLTTNYARTLLLNQNAWIVTYQYHDAPTNTPNATKKFVYPATFTHPTGSGTGTPPTPPSGYTFDGWYENENPPASPAPDTKLIPGTTIITKAQPVHARWTAAAPPDSEITLTVTFDYSKYSSVNPFTFGYSGSDTGPIPNISTYTLDPDDPENITITITNTSDAALAGATFNWYYNGVAVGTPGAASLTIPFTTDNTYLLEGTHTFSVEATIGGYAKHSGWFEVEVAR